MVTLAPRLESSYYGLNQRAWSRLDAGAAGYVNKGVPTNQLDRMELFYYDASWRLLERRTDETWNGTSFVHDSTSQWVWGQRYIDELVASITDGDVNDEFEDRYYAMTDRNFSVIGLSQSAGSSGERIRYDAYGHAQAMPLGDVDHNGAVDLDDQNILLVDYGADIGDTGSPLYRVEADFDSNGTLDLDDFNTVITNFGDSIERGRLSGSGNIVGYAGYIFEPATGMYVVRHRWYSAENGRWLSRDPSGYIDGQNHLAYVSGRPIAAVDPMGLLLLNPAGEVHGLTIGYLWILFASTNLTAYQIYEQLVNAGFPSWFAAQVAQTDESNARQQYERLQRQTLDELMALAAAETIEEAEELWKRYLRKLAENARDSFELVDCKAAKKHFKKMCGETGSNANKSPKFSCKDMRTRTSEDCDKIYERGVAAMACASARSAVRLLCYKDKSESFVNHINEALKRYGNGLDCFIKGKACREKHKGQPKTGQDSGC